MRRPLFVQGGNEVDDEAGASFLEIAGEPVLAEVVRFGGRASIAPTAVRAVEGEVVDPIPQRDTAALLLRE